MPPEPAIAAADREPDARGWTDGLAEAFPSLRGVRIAIVDYLLVDPASGRINTGGTETYALTLTEVARALGGDVLHLQRSRTPLPPRTLRPGLSLRTWRRPRDLPALLREVRAEAAGRPVVTVLFVEDFVPGPEDQPSIFLHHGIVHDGAFERRPLRWPMTWIRDARKLWVWHRRRRQHYRLVTRTSRTVSVDTNVANVTRYMFPQLDWAGRITYLPNFGTLLPRADVVEKWRSGRPYTVLFARRFVMKRGTFLWADALAELAPRFPAVRFRCVGRGPGEPWLRALAGRHPNVEVLERPHAEMVEEHRRAHLAVVPSEWSEGTSLSAIEAMCAGAAVVSTDVGGLGNLVVPDATGVVAAATPAAFRDAVARLLEQPAEARRLGLAGYRVASASFSMPVWAERMCRVMAEVVADPAPRPPPRRVAPAPGVL